MPSHMRIIPSFFKKIFNTGMRTADSEHKSVQTEKKMGIHSFSSNSLMLKFPQSPRLAKSGPKHPSWPDLLVRCSSGQKVVLVSFWSQTEESF